MGGVFARRVWEKSNHKKKEDFLFCHLDGRRVLNEGLLEGVQQDDYLHP